MKRLFAPAMWLILLAACAPQYWGAAADMVPVVAAIGYKEGGTVKVLSSTRAAVYLEYSHAYTPEFGAAARIAEAECQKHKRHAVLLVGPTKLDVDRSAVSFECVP